MSISVQKAVVVLQYGSADSHGFLFTRSKALPF